MGIGDILQYLFSFAFVIALLLSLLYALRKLQHGSVFAQRANRLEVMDSLALAPRMRVVLVRVDQREVLLGVSPSEINLLQALPEGSLNEAVLSANHSRARMDIEGDGHGPTVMGMMRTSFMRFGHRSENQK